LTVFNFALETGPVPRSPAAGAPGRSRPRVLKTRRGTREDEFGTPSTIVQAVPHEPVDDGYDFSELVDAAAVEPDVEAIFSSRNSSGLRQTAVRSVDTISAPENRAFN